MSPRLGSIVLFLFAIVLAIPLGPGGARAQEVEAPKTPTFDMTYDVGIVASEKSAHVKITLGAGSEVVEWIIFRFDPMRHRAIEADGELREVENGLEWKPPAGGGTIRHERRVQRVSLREFALQFGANSRSKRRWRKNRVAFTTPAGTSQRSRPFSSVRPSTGSRPSKTNLNGLLARGRSMLSLNNRFNQGIFCSHFSIV